MDGFPSILYVHQTHGLYDCFTTCGKIEKQTIIVKTSYKSTSAWKTSTTRCNFPLITYKRIIICEKSGIVLHIKIRNTAAMVTFIIIVVFLLHTHSGFIVLNDSINVYQISLSVSFRVSFATGYSQTCTKKTIHVKTLFWPFTIIEVLLSISSDSLCSMPKTAFVLSFE